jgi:hypothetical protein
MRRYACRIGSMAAGDAAGVKTWIVVKTDELPHLELMTKGFEKVLHTLSEVEMKERYSVGVIYTVNEDRTRKQVN